MNTKEQEMSDDRKSPPAPRKKAWQRPQLKYVGSVSEIFEFPGGGKLSMIAEDMGDAQRKPKGVG
jgi:hypothetical protein